MTKTIHLGYHNAYPVVLSDTGYEQLLEFIQQHRVCKNGCLFSDLNQMVAQNLCLSCLLQKQDYLTFVGPLGEPDADGYQTFKFISEQGYVYLSNTRYDIEAKQDPHQTLLHWHFPVPTSYRPFRSESDMQFYPGAWQICGDLRASALVIQRYYDQKHAAVFLSYKDGAYRELTRRDGEMKRLLEEATDIVEESKDEQGRYHYGGHVVRTIREEWVYEVVSLIASAVYDVKQRFLSTARQEDTSAEEPAS